MSRGAGGEVATPLTLAVVPGFTGNSESAGINRHVVGAARALQARK
jgi:hypothetical protein